MLRNTFCHIEGVGATTERRLWEAGVRSWDDVCNGTELPLSGAKQAQLAHHCRESLAALAQRDAQGLGVQLPPSQLWRLFAEFRDSVAYLDIETTGLDDRRNYITTIGIYDGTSVFQYVKGKNLEQFAVDIQKYRLLVTYNGKCFDVPFLRSRLGIPLDQAHIDLRYVLAGLGYKGGLKACERRLGLDRGELADVDGYFAVLLWFDYFRGGNEAALETLLAYNALDVVNLATLMAVSYNQWVARTPFAATHVLPVPEPPELALKADASTIERILDRL